MPDLRPFQVIGRDFLNSRKAALLADEQGLGKTPQAITAINDVGPEKSLIVCKAIGKITWPVELRRWLNRDLKIHVMNGVNAKVDPTANVTIVNYNLLVIPAIFMQLVRGAYGVGVFDESHYLKGAESKRTRAVLLRGALASRCTYKWFMTGTPVLNRPVELYPLLRSVAPHVIAPYLTFDQFAKRYCDAYWDGFQLVAKGASNVEELNHRLLTSGFMLRRLKKDVLPELPDKQYQLISLPAPNAATKELVKKEFTFSKSDAKHSGASEGVDVARLRHQLAIAKTPTCIEHIKDVLEETPKVVVFAYHTAVIDKLREAFGEACVFIDGRVSDMKKRFDNVERFQNDPTCKVFIGQIDACGDTITLTAASTVIFVESSWVPGIIDQATDRLHRIGQKDAVNVQFLVLADSVEENMLRTVIDKKETIRRVIDEDPEVSYLFT